MYKDSSIKVKKLCFYLEPDHMKRGIPIGALSRSKEAFTRYKCNFLVEMDPRHLRHCLYLHSFFFLAALKFKSKLRPNSPWKISKKERQQLGS